MLLERFPKNYNYLEIKKIIEENDIKITNLESVISNYNCFASTFCGGQWINSEPDNLNDIKKYGFNLYGCANNHSMDYSFDGLLSTCKELKNQNMFYAGIGRSLKDSSKPVFYELPNKKIKVAFLSVTSTFIDAARAGNAKDTIPARPGVNYLRVQTKYNVTREHFEQLKDIAKSTYINGGRDNARKIGSLPPEEANSINFGGHFFVVTDEEEGKFTYCNKNDLNRILDEIRNAKKTADYVIISVHSHQIKRNSYTEPDYFLEEFSHKCIDQGACAVIGSGTHQLKPIEIYKGKPIFYSLGNFLFELEKVNKLPLDFWDKYNYDYGLSVKDGLNKKTKNGTIGLEIDKNNYLSIIPLMYFEDEELQQLKLIPIELSFDSKDFKGLPVIANKEDALNIFKQLKKISFDYNTRFEFDEIINVKLEGDKDG